MEVQTEFRQTEYGPLPSGWELQPLLKLSSFITKGSTPTTYGYDWQVDGIRFLRSECVAEHGLDLKESMFISEEAHSMLDRSEVRSGDLLMTITGNVGRTILLDEDFGTGNINQHVARVRITDSRLDKRFALHFLSQRRVREYYQSITTGQAYPQISLKQVRETEIPLPPRPEQRAIADALSDVDALIERLDALIAKKRAIKTATMQRLLTGQQRLPGFSAPWTTKRLGEVADIQSGINKATSAMGAGALYVTVKDLYAGVSIPTHELGRIEVSREEVETYCLKPHDIVFGKSSVKREGIGYPSQFLGCSEPVVFSGFTYRIRAIEGISHPNFLFYILRLRRTRKWLISNSQASALTNINQSIAERIPVAVPEIKEQEAMATILSDMDAEIEAIQTRRRKTQAIKQGMMQELLTGRTRLV